MKTKTFLLLLLAMLCAGCEKKSDTLFETDRETRDNFNGVDAVDLGLSVKWANVNIGATSPESYGNYYAWGETTTKSVYDWSTYRLCKGSYDTQTKYCTSIGYGVVDNITTLELIDDVAHITWGGTWRMPTHEEMNELYSRCSWTWTVDYKNTGISGYIVTSEVPGNNNSIFLPLAGYYNNSSLCGDGSGGFYWSSSLYPNGSYRAYCFELVYGGYRTSAHYCNRLDGNSVRAVCP